MTFGSGSNGCLGHGNLTDISQVGVLRTLERGSELQLREGRTCSGLELGKNRKRPQWLPTCCCICALCVRCVWLELKGQLPSENL